MQLAQSPGLLCDGQVGAMALYDAFLLPWPLVLARRPRQSAAPLPYPTPRVQASSRAGSPQLRRWAAGVAALATSRKVGAPAR